MDRSSRSLVPKLGCQWQLIEFGAGFAPRRVVFLEDGDEALTVGGLDEMGHLVDDYILKEVFGLILVRLGGLAILQHMLSIGIELVTLVAIGSGRLLKFKLSV